MATDHPRVRAHVMPPKVIGMGAPVSVWIYFEVREIPALAEAIGDELARRGCAPATDGHTQPETDVDSADRGEQIDLLRQMLADLERADAIWTTRGRFDVVWRTALARDVIHGAVAHAKRRADNAAAGDRRARGRARMALAAALDSRRDFDAVDDPDGVWL
jgi:hypothetical protein